jgi:4-amino-4-deoxy-L-arabinose transferase-like glycosyltransferase
MLTALHDPSCARQVARPPQAAAPAVGRGLLLLIALTIAVRLIAIDRPLVGVFATKNVVYAMIARNWALGRAPLWRPTVDALVGGERGLHLVEFPVSAYLTGGLWRAFGGSLDVWGRLTSVGWSAASVALMFLLVRRWHGPAAAYGAALTMALAPVSIIYGQSFMLEASVAALTLATFYFLDEWLGSRRWPWLVAISAAFGLLVLTKVYMLVLLLPLALWPGVTSLRTKCVAMAVLLLAAVPAIAWYGDAYRAAGPHSPLAAHVFYSVRASADVHRVPHPLLSQPDFYAQALADLATRVLSPVGFLLALAAFFDRGWRRHAVWLASMALLMAALPRKFHEMNYYYLVVLPPLAVLAGLGWQVLYNRWRPGRLAMAALLVVAAAGALRYAVHPAFCTPDEDRAVTAAASAVRELTRPDEPVATMHGSTIDLLYYCDRAGWNIPPDLPHLQERLAECRRYGARYLVVAGWDRLDHDRGDVRFLAALSKAAEGDDFRILELAPSLPQ